MLEQINKLTKRELKTLKKVTAIVKKVYGVKEEDIDNLFYFAKTYKDTVKTVNESARAINSIANNIQANGIKVNQEKLTAIEKAMENKDEVIDYDKLV